MWGACLFSAHNQSETDSGQLDFTIAPNGMKNWSPSEKQFKLEQKLPTNTKASKRKDANMQQPSCWHKQSWSYF